MGWDSYRQFCMLFLYPLMLNSHLDIDYRDLLKSNLDGVEPSFMFKVFGYRNILKKGALSHIILPHIIEKNILKNERDTSKAKNRSNIKHSKISVIAIVDSMLSLVSKLHSKNQISAWADYDHKNTYEDEDNATKYKFIGDICKKNTFNNVWDMGANTGLFSEHISPYVGNIISMDGDAIAVERMYKRLQDKSSNINPIVMDIHNMSPNHGFNSKERTKLESRANPDLVMCLAVIHHIRISANIPCDNFLSYLRSLNSKIIIEFVCREDEMVIKLLTNKNEKYIDYNIETFEKSVKNFFVIKNSVELKNGKRVLFFLEPM